LSNGFSCSGRSASGRIENDVFTGQRYAAIARETAILSAQHLYRFDEQRRLATLVVFAREMEVELTDAALIMFDKMMGGVFRKADRRHKDQLVNRAKMLHSSTRVLVSMAKAMLSARANGTDPLAAIEQTIGWQRLEALVEAMARASRPPGQTTWLR